MKVPNKSKIIRVVVNALHAKSGGGVTYLRNLLPEMAKDKTLEIHLFIHRDQLVDLSDIDERIRLHVFNFKTTFIRLLLWEQIFLPILLMDVAADVVLSPANYGPLILPNQIIVLQNSLAVGACEQRWRKKLYWTALSMMTAASLQVASAAVAVSDYVVKTAVRLPERVRWKISVIHHGVGEQFHPGQEERQDYLLAVGDLYVQKNFANLIDAIGHLRATYPDVSLKIAGRAVDQEYADGLAERVRSLGLENNIEFLGHCTPAVVADLYRRCQVFIFPSIEESFGMPVLEALASGCPLACSNTAAMPEVAGDAVRYFRPDDSREIAQVVADFMSDRRLRDEYAVKAVERAAMFRWSEAALRFGALVHKVASKGRKEA